MIGALSGQVYEGPKGGEHKFPPPPHVFRYVMSQRLLVVSPVHNEAPHIERVARALAAQQRPPDAWIVVDDASTDGTFERLRALERELEFLIVVRAPDAPEGDDRLALANEIRAFNHGLQRVDLGSSGSGSRSVDEGSSDSGSRSVDEGSSGSGSRSVDEGSSDSGSRSVDEGSSDSGSRSVDEGSFNHGLQRVDLGSFTHIAKLDGDVELPPEWYAVLLERFAADPMLGIACGQLEEGPEGARGVIPIPSHHVHGAVKLYSLSCFRAIGGLQPRLGWDTIDETYARMHGFSTCSFPDPVAIHHRPFATRDGVLRGRARHGACAYIAHQSLPWVAARAVKVGRARPAGIGGGAFLYGYLRAAVDGTARVEDPALRRFVRRELRTRVWQAVAPTRVGQAS